MKDRRRQTTTAGGGQAENAGCSGSAGAENRNELHSGQDPYEFCFAIGGGRFKQTGLNKSNPNSINMGVRGCALRDGQGCLETAQV